LTHDLVHDPFDHVVIVNRRRRIGLGGFGPIRRDRVRVATFVGVDQPIVVIAAGQQPASRGSDTRRMCQPGTRAFGRADQFPLRDRLGANRTVRDATSGFGKFDSGNSHGVDSG